MDLARTLFESLQSTKNRLVLAESCTGGLVACELTKVPGISNVFCGSVVTYRDDTKQRWLGVDGETIHNLTSVSAPVAHQMARGVLSQTPEATIAISITGHLGPDAPDGLDGVVFIGSAKMVKGKSVVNVLQHALTKTDRKGRQAEAAELVMQSAIDSL